MKLSRVVSLSVCTAWIAAMAGTMAFAATSPKEACEKLAEATKNGDFSAFQQLSVAPKGHMGMHGKKGGRMEGKMKNEFQAMRQKYMNELKDLKCSSEQIAEDHAVVTAETANNKRIIPFVKEGEQWKFDVRTYMAFYRGSQARTG